MAEPSRRLRVCQAVGTTEGAHWVFEQLRALRDWYGFAVGAVIPNGPGNLVDALQSDGIACHRAFLDVKLLRYLGLPRRVFAMARLFRRERYDIVQSHIFPTMLICRLAAWIADVPVRLSMVAGPYHMEVPLFRQLDLATCWMETAIIPSCEFTYSLYIKGGVARRRLHLIYYGPDERRIDMDAAPLGVRRHYGWPEGTPVVAMVSYFYGAAPASWIFPAYMRGKDLKGHEDLIRAAPLVLREFPTAKFLLVGSAWGLAGEKLMADMRRLVRDLDLEESVKFHGRVSDLCGLYNDIDVSVQAPISDNPGGSVETLLMSKPIVATAVGGMLDTVVEGETGFLVRPNDPGDLARGIVNALRDPARAHSLAAGGRRRMLAGFTLRTTVARLNALYRELAGRPGYRNAVTVGRSLLFLTAFGTTALFLVPYSLFRESSRIVRRVKRRLFRQRPRTDRQ